MQVVFDLDLQPVQSSVLPLNADDAIAIGRYLLVFRILTIPFTARDDFNGDVRHRFSIEQYTETGCFSSDQVIGMGEEVDLQTFTGYVHGFTARFAIGDDRLDVVDTLTDLEIRCCCWNLFGDRGCRTTPAFGFSLIFIGGKQDLVHDIELVTPFLLSCSSKLLRKRLCVIFSGKSGLPSGAVILRLSSCNAIWSYSNTLVAIPASTRIDGASPETTVEEGTRKA